MKANLAYTFITALIIMICLVITSPAAFAGDKSSEPLSQIGIERGLEIYKSEKSDTCVLGALQIRINVTGMTREGMLTLEMFGEHKFMKKEGRLRRVRVPAEDGSQMVCFNLPYPGPHAIVGYHDKNGDRKLKKRWDFKPLEPFGLSNNPKIRALRLPKYSETGFDVPMEGVDITIEMVDLTKKD